MSFTNADGEQETDSLIYNHQDFWTTTSNKQLNLVQHIRTMLKSAGRTSGVIPDNVLFEGGAGKTIRRKLFFGDNRSAHDPTINHRHPLCARCQSKCDLL